MAFFKRHKTENGKGFDLFGAYAFYIPGGTGIFWLTVMFILGAILGNLITVGLTYAVSANFATRYGMLISYPVMFIPAMLFASSASRRHYIQTGGGRRRGIPNSTFIEKKTPSCPLPPSQQRS